MRREKISLPGETVAVVDVDDAAPELHADATMVEDDGTTSEHEIRGDAYIIKYPDGNQLEGKIQPDGSIRLTVGIEPDGTRHPCDIVI